MFSRSVDGGKIFFPAIGIDHYSEKSWCPLISVDSAGNIYVVWEEGTAISRKILISRSADGGVSFSSPLILSTTTVDSFCPSLAVNDAGRVYVTWSIGGYFDKTLQSFLVFSSDRGATFSTSLKIPSMSGEVGCPKIIAGDLNQIGFGWHAPPMATAVSDIFYSSGQVSIP